MQRRDSTAIQPWDGIWDLTPTLQTYGIEVPCPQSEYCDVEYPALAGGLQGTLVLHITPTDTSASASIIGAFCDSPTSAGCVHAGPPRPASLTGTLAITRTGGADVISDLELDVPGVDYTVREHIYLSQIVAAGDSIYGKLYWARYVARNPPHYLGTFVARRHPMP